MSKRPIYLFSVEHPTHGFHYMRSNGVAVPDFDFDKVSLYGLQLWTDSSPMLRLDLERNEPFFSDSNEGLRLIPPLCGWPTLAYLEPTTAATLRLGDGNLYTVNTRRGTPFFISNRPFALTQLVDRD